MRETVRCDMCMVKESKPGDHKQCARCKNANYCSKECQLSHWKSDHKKWCKLGPAGKCNVEDDRLLGIAGLLADNYSKTVREETGNVVLVEDKLSATPGLVRLMKTLLLTQKPQFNSPEQFASFGSDPDVLDAIDRYFEKQRGFESISKFNHNPEVKRAREEMRTAGNGTNFRLGMSEEHLNKYVIGLVGSIARDLSKRGHHNIVKENFEQAVLRTTAFIKTLLQTRPEINSPEGLLVMGLHEPVKLEIVSIVAEALGIKENTANRAQERGAISS